MKIVNVEGIGPKFAAKLQKAGIRSTDALLKKGATYTGKKEIEEKSGIAHATILEWVNHVDLYRIKGIGSEYSDLLEEAGVDTVVELAKRKAENLVGKIAEINAKRNWCINCLV